MGRLKALVKQLDCTRHALIYKVQTLVQYLFVEVQQILLGLLVFVCVCQCLQLMVLLFDPNKAVRKPFFLNLLTIRVHHKVLQTL